jgi:hypothetical protein
MTKYLLLALMVVFAVSEGVAAQESIIKKYQNDLATPGVRKDYRQEEPLKLAMGPVSAPHLPSGSPNNPPAPSSGCPTPDDSCKNQSAKVPHRHKHHQ